jgi:4-aminobutyrate aminotransferase-like enzyme
VERRAKHVLQLLRDYESRNVTFIEPDGSWPIIWHRAKGCYVWDIGGKRYLDLTAAFGVAAAGHANPYVIRAARRQMNLLVHAMGDVHPHEAKALLARELSRLTFERWALEGFAGVDPPGSKGKTIFCNSGFEAVEAGLKTALLATGKRGIVAFQHGYHGLGYGSLNATHRQHFRRPFLPQLAKFGRFVRFPVREEELGNTEISIERALSRQSVGAILVEPIQVRGGIHVPPPGFLPMLRRICDAHGVLLILDEIYTGFGRTGRWFACEHAGVAPDVLCVGKALTGGFPLSACVGRSDLMDQAWPASSGEAIHTSTFLGHPVGCAMALAQITELARLDLPRRAADVGERLRASLAGLVAPAGMACEVRGQGLLMGLALRGKDGGSATGRVLSIIKAMLHRGYILLPEGEESDVIAFTPPLTIGEKELRNAVSVLKTLLELS